MECGAELAGDTAIGVCLTCGGLLDAIVALPDRLSPGDIGRNLPPHLARSGVWRYRALLPAIPDDAIVTRQEGNTPLYHEPRLATYAGLSGSFSVKHEGHNPTASFKDRGMTVGVSHAKAVGAKIVACASTGNTSASLASYAAAAGMPALVLIPEGKISAGKLAQTISYGARVVQVEGDFDVALRLLRELTTAQDVYLCNSVNPFRLEGQKSIIFELMEQLDWQVPDVIALPGGNLGNTSAFGKALGDLHQVGLIDRLPKLAIIQAEGSAPFSHYYASGWDKLEPVTAETIATAIKIGNPASTPRARRSVESTNGLVTTVSDAEIMNAKATIDQVGIGCEPASAASLAGTRRLVSEGKIAPDATVVGILTGHVLKDTDAIVAYHLHDVDDAPRPGSNRPVRVEPTLAALERVLADALHG
jgi:threonine synthase